MSTGDFFLNINHKLQHLHNAMVNSDFQTAGRLYVQIKGEIQAAGAVFEREKDKIAALNRLESQLWEQYDEASCLTAMLSAHLVGRVTLEQCISELDECVVALAKRTRFSQRSVGENAKLLAEQRRLYEEINQRLKEEPNVNLGPKFQEVTGHIAQLSVYMELRQEYSAVWDSIGDSWGALEKQSEQLETSRALPEVNHFPDMLAGLRQLQALMKKYAIFLKQRPNFAEDIDKLLKSDIKMLENSAMDFYDELCGQLGAELSEARMRFDAALIESDIKEMRLAHAYWRQVEGRLRDASAKLLQEAHGVDKRLISFAKAQEAKIKKILAYPGRSLERAAEEIDSYYEESREIRGEEFAPKDVRKNFRKKAPVSKELKARLALHQRRLAPVVEWDEKTKRWIGIGLLGLEVLSGVQGAVGLWREGRQIEQMGERLHWKQIEAIPLEERERIDRDASIIGSLLSQGNRVVTMDESAYQTLIRKLSEAGREALAPYRLGRAFDKPADVVMKEYTDSQIRLHLSPEVEYVAPSNRLINRVSRIFSDILYGAGYETPEHLEARLAPRVRELSEKANELRIEASNLIEAAEKYGLSAKIEVPDIPTAIRDVAVEQALPKVSADLQRAEKEVEALRGRFVTSQQLEKQLVQLKGFMEREPKGPMDNRLFQHLVLPFSGKATGFEGYSPAAMLDYNLMLAEQWVEAIEENPLCSTEDKSELCHTIFSDRAPIEDPELKVFRGLRDSLRTAVRMTRAMRGDLDTFHREVAAQLKTMRKGDSFFLHSGWKTPAGAHSIAIEFINEGKSYSVRIYNQGEGLERHAKPEKGPPSYLTFLEWENIDPEMIASPAFLGSLAALDRGEFGDKVGPEEMYETIMPMLEGQYSRRSYSDEHTQRLLSVGHCTRTSLEAIYHQHLDHTGRFDRFTLLTRVKALQHMYKTFQSNLIEEKQSRELLRLGAQQIAHDITGASAMVFSDGERIYVQELLEQVEKSIEAADRVDSEAQRSARPLIDVSVPAKVMGKEVDFYTTPTLAPPLKFGERSKLEVVDVDRLSLMIRTYTPSPATVAHHLASVIDTMSTPEEFRVFFPELIQRLPFEVPANSTSPIPFWSEIPPEDAARLLDNLVNGNWNFAMGLVAHRSGTMRSIDTMVLLKILTLADILVQQLPEKDRVRLDHLLLPVHRLFLENSMPNSELTNASWQKQFAQLQNYWLERRKDVDPSGPSFFFTEGFVPGMSWQGIEYGAEPSYDEGQWAPQLGHDRGDRLVAPWRAFEWAVDWVESNPKAIPEKMSSRMKAGLALSSERALPKGFYILYAISIDLGLLNAGYSDDNILTSPPQGFLDKPRLSATFSKEEKMSPPCVIFKYQSRWNFEYIEDVSMIGMPSSLSGVQTGSLPKVAENRKPLYIESGGSKLMGNLRKRIPPTARVLYREEIATLDIPAQLARRLEGCSSIKSLQISETLALFNENRELLDRPDTLQLLGKLLLEPGLLEHHLSSNPAAAEATLRTLSTMFEEHYRLKEALGEMEKGAALLQFYHPISQIVAKFSDMAFFDARTRWRQLLTQDITPEQRSRFAADLAMSYADSETLGPDAVDDIISALLFFDMVPLSPSHPLWSKEQQQQFNDLPKRLAGLLHQALPDKDDLVLSRAISRVVPDFTERSFYRSKTDSHLFVDEAGDVEVNLLTGHVWIRNGLPRVLPWYVLYQAPIESLSAAHNQRWLETVPGHFRCSTPQGELFILTGEYQNVKEVHWKRGETLLRHSFWNGISNPATSGVKFIQQSGLLWLDTEVAHAGLVTEDLTPHYHLDIPNDSVQEVKANNGLVLGEVPEAFALLDAPTFIGTWIDRDSGQIEKIEIPRLGLEFNIHTVNGQRRAYCPRFPGWYAPVDTHIPALGKITDYMLLYKDLPDGTIVKQVIIPSWTLEHGTPLAPTLEPKTGGDLKTRAAVYRYNIDEESGQLRPLTGAGALHLASYYLHQRDYRRAIELMDEPGIAIAKLDNEQRQRIITLTKMPETTKDYSPASLAAAMEAHYLLIRDAWHFGTRTQVGDIDIPNPWERKWSQVQFAKDFLEYLQVADQMGIYTLSAEKMSLLTAYAQQLAEIVRRGDMGHIANWYYYELQDTTNMLKKRLSVPLEGATYSGGGWYTTTMIQKNNDYWNLEGGVGEVQEYSRDYLEKRAEYNSYYKRRVNLTDVVVNGEKVRDLPAPQQGDKFLEWVNVELDFFNLYLKVRYPTAENLRQLVVYLTGVEPVDNPRAEAIAALRAHRMRTNFLHTRVLWTLILSVLLNPDEWPTSGRKYIGTKINPWHDLPYQSPKYKGPESRIERAAIPEPLLAKQTQPTNFPDAGFELCTKLKPDVVELHRPMLSQFGEVMQMRPMQAAERQLRDQELKRLEAVFDVATEDPYLKGAFGSVAKEVEEFRQHLEDETLFGVKAGEEQKLQTWSKELGDTAQLLQYDLEQAQHLVVELANKEPEDPILRARLRQELGGKTLEPIEFNELASFLLTRDLDEMHRRLPQLSAEEIHRLFDMTVEALKIGRLQRMASFQKQLVDTLYAAVKRGDPPMEISRIGKLLHAAHSYHPSYASDERPEYLVYDYFMSKSDPAFRLREDQVEVLEALPQTQFHAHSDHLTGVLLEAIMGFGKTAVVSVLQAIQSADGEKLVAVSMPEVLLPSMSATLERLLSAGFRRRVEVVNFGRDSDISAPALRHMLERLESIRSNRRVMLISSGSALSIALRFAELCLEGNTVTDEQLELMGKIVDILRTSGAANLDEVDLLLDVLRAHLFTLGDRERMHKDLERASVSLFQAVATDPKLRNLIRWPFAESTSSIPFSEDNYKQHAKQALIDAVLAGKICPDDHALQSFLEGLDKTSRAHISAYLNATPPRPEALILLFSRLSPDERKTLAAYIVDGQNADALLATFSTKERAAIDDYRQGRIDPAYSYVAEIHNPRIRNLLASLKEQISSLFPLVMNKILGENFGPMPKEWRADQPDMDFIAIPYHGSDNPVKRSLHGTVTEILDYTLFMHLANPISHEIIDRETKALKQALDKEKEGFVGSIEDLESYQTFYRLNGNDRSYILKDTLSLRDREKMAKHINAHPELKLELIERHVLPQVKRYAKQLGLSAQMVAYLFKTVKAYSGTVWNRETFPQLFHTFIPSDTQPRTLALLWENSPHSIRTLPFSPKGTPLNERLESLYEENFTGSFADLSGVYRYDDNLDVARAIIELPQFEASRYKGIMYHDEEGREMVLRRGAQTPVPLLSAGMSRDDVAGYWAQKYCTGVDWKLHPLEEAIVSIGRQTLMRDGLQAVWRLRGLASGQKVRFVVSEEDKQVISASLKRDFGIEVGDELQLEHFFIYAVSLEKERLRIDIPRALSEALRANLIDKVFGAISGAKGSDLRTLFEATAKLFVIEEPDSPWEQLGKTPTEAPSEIVVRENIKQLIDSEPFKAFSTHPLLKAKYSTETLKQELYAIADPFYAKMPPVLQTPIGDRNNREVQIETQTQKMMESNRQQEQQKQKQKEMQVEMQNPLFNEQRPVLLLPKNKLCNSTTWEPVPLASVASEKQPPNQMVKVQDIGGPVFDDGLLIDLNLAPLYQRTSEKQAPYAPWNAYQDYSSNIVVIDNGRSIRLALVGQDTAKQLQDDLSKQPGGDVKIALLNLGSGAVTQGPEPIDLMALEQSGKFIRLKVQAKFFDGRIHYTADELPQLERWIRECGYEAMQKLFEQKILANKGYSQQHYASSSLHKLFVHLEEEAQKLGI
ncbi:MAG: DUF3638 domain-containing protein [Verrucomicrobia bacterium]|nr:DUF3638 domain-containing protein [Verrucomicrobiota bacterium]